MKTEKTSSALGVVSYCRNCLENLNPKVTFCHSCGAKIIKNRLTLANLAEDFNDRFLSIDAAFPKTFIALFTKPEDVIGGYIEGVRKKYLSAFGYFALSLSVAGIYVFILREYFLDTFLSNFELAEGQTEAEVELRKAEIEAELEIRKAELEAERELRVKGMKMQMEERRAEMEERMEKNRDRFKAPDSLNFHARKINASQGKNYTISYPGKESRKPLVIKDGKEVNEFELQMIDPQVIDSVNVMKGEAANKKYGADRLKGKSGVIEIFTKKEN